MTLITLLKGNTTFKEMYLWMEFSANNKILFMGIQNASKKWTMPVRNWSLTISQLAIHFEGRLDKALNL